MSSKTGLIAQIAKRWASLGKLRTYISITIILVTVYVAFIYASPGRVATVQHTAQPSKVKNNSTKKIADNKLDIKTTSKIENKTSIKTEIKADNAAKKVDEKPGPKTDYAMASKTDSKPNQTTDKAQADHSEISTSDNNQGVLSLALFMMSFALLISVAVSFYLYRWRKILLAKQNLAIPEVFVGSVTGLNKGVQQLSQALVTHMQQLIQKNNSMETRIAEMTETFLTLQNSLDRKDLEIKRLKEGYDAGIFRKFLIRFVRVDQVIEDYKLEKPELAEDLNQIQRILVDAFEECNVERFSPEIGTDYRHSEGVADNPRVIKPESEDHRAYHITEILEDGYRLVLQDGFDIILPARVKIYGKQ